VLQDPKDESATLLLEKIKTEKRRLFKDMDVGPSKMLSPVSPDDFPFELPEGWVWARLGEIAQHNSGKTLDSGRNTGSLREYLTTSNLYWGYFELANLRRMPIEDDEVDRCTASRGDLLICEGGEAGRAAVWNEDYVICFQNHIHRVRLLCSINPYYVFRYFQKMNYTGEINLHRKGMGISNISGRALSLIVVPLSPISEQRRIVAKVDQLMALCDELEEKQKKRNETRISLNTSALDHLLAAKDPKEFDTHWQRISSNFDLLYDKPETVSKLRQAILQLAVQGKLVPQDPKDEPASMLLEKIKAEKERLVKEKKIKKSGPLPPIAEDEIPYELPKGWMWATLDSISLQITDGTHITPTYTPKGIPFLSVKDVSSGQLDFANTKFISREQHQEYAQRCKPERGDILLTKVGTTGIAVEVNNDQEFSIFVSLALLKFSGLPLYTKYIEFVLNSPLMRAMSEAGTEGVGNKNLVLRKIRRFPVPLAPLPEQKRILERVGVLLAVCDELETNLTHAEEASEELVEAVVISISN